MVVFGIKVVLEGPKLPSSRNDSLIYETLQAWEGADGRFLILC